MSGSGIRSLFRVVYEDSGCYTQVSASAVSREYLEISSHYPDGRKQIGTELGIIMTVEHARLLHVALGKYLDNL